MCFALYRFSCLIKNSEIFHRVEHPEIINMCSCPSNIYSLYGVSRSTYNVISLDIAVCLADNVSVSMYRTLLDHKHGGFQQKLHHNEQHILSFDVSPV